jgi:hypothetical protein
VLFLVPLASFICLFLLVLLEWFPFHALPSVMRIQPASMLRYIVLIWCTFEIWRHLSSMSRPVSLKCVTELQTPLVFMNTGVSVITSCCWILRHNKKNCLYTWYSSSLSFYVSLLEYTAVKCVFGGLFRGELCFSGIEVK